MIERSTKDGRLVGITFHNRSNVTAVRVEDITIGVKIVMKDVARFFAALAKMSVVNVHPPVRE